MKDLEKSGKKWISIQDAQKIGGDFYIAYKNLMPESPEQVEDIRYCYGRYSSIDGWVAVSFDEWGYEIDLGDDVVEILGLVPLPKFGENK